MKNLTGAEFESKVLQAERPVLLEFYTPTCPACRAMAPALEGLAKEFEGRAEVYGVNAAEEMELADAFQIQAVPTMVIFKEGEPVEAWVGGRPAASIREKLLRAA